MTCFHSGQFASSSSKKLRHQFTSDDARCTQATRRDVYNCSVGARFDVLIVREAIAIVIMELNLCAVSKTVIQCRFPLVRVAMSCFFL